MLAFGMQGEEADQGGADKDRQLTSPTIKKEKDIKREKDVKKEVKVEKDHREQHRSKDAKVAESEIVRDLRAQLKYVLMFIEYIQLLNP